MWLLIGNDFFYFDMEKRFIIESEFDFYKLVLLNFFLCFIFYFDRICILF